jgi:hypothetical protein
LPSFLDVNQPPIKNFGVFFLLFWEEPLRKIIVVYSSNASQTLGESHHLLEGLESRRGLTQSRAHCVILHQGLNLTFNGPVSSIEVYPMMGSEPSLYTFSLASALPTTSSSSKAPTSSKFCRTLRSGLVLIDSGMTEKASSTSDPSTDPLR